MKMPALISALWRRVRPVEPPASNRIFEGNWRRQWRIDDTGIHEFRQGQPHTTVFWFDLADIDGQKLRAINGSGSTVLLPQERLRKFRRAVYTEWERRFPERVRAYRALALRRSAWFTFLWLPLFYVACCLPFYFLPPSITLRRGISAADFSHRLTVVSAVSLGFFWTVYGYAYWKFRALDTSTRQARSCGR